MKPIPRSRPSALPVAALLLSGLASASPAQKGTGYLTGNAPELHFGLGKAEGIDSIEVLWPDGETTTASGSLDSWQTITRGE